MAQKTNKSSGSPDKKVTRIKATDTEPVTKPKEAKASSKSSVETSKPKPKKAKKSGKNPFAALGGYFKGAWYELGQVRWPTRRATWGMTFAVLAYTAVFVTLIILLDLGFNKLLEAFIG